MSGSENENDQIIVINDLLSFVWCKVKVTSKQKLIECIEEFYSMDEALEALKTLTTALPTGSQNVEKKLKESPFESIIEILGTLYENDLPMFVCKNLNNLPKLDNKKEQSHSLIKNKKEFYKEHQKIKSQLNEVFSSLYELKRQFQVISDNEGLNNEISSNEKPTNEFNFKQDSNCKDLVYLQNLINEKNLEQKVGLYIFLSFNDLFVF